jgi:hypothetical protein
MSVCFSGNVDSKRVLCIVLTQADCNLLVLGETVCFMVHRLL